MSIDPGILLQGIYSSEMIKVKDSKVFVFSPESKCSVIAIFIKSGAQKLVFSNRELVHINNRTSFEQNQNSIHEVRK